MKLVALLVFTSVLVVSVQSFGDEISDIIFKKYAMLKIFEDCYGKETVRNMFKEVKQACAKCRGQSSAPVSMMELAAAAMTTKPMEETNKKPSRPQKPQQPVQAMPDSIQQSFPLMMAMQPQQKPVMPSMSPWAMGYFGPVPYGHPVYQRLPSHYDYLYGSGMMMGPPTGGSYRPKRQHQSAESGDNRPMTDDGNLPSMMPNHDEKIGFGITFDKLRKMSEMIQTRIGNITCVMKELGFLGADMQPDYDSIKERIEELPISEDMKNDLCEGIEECKTFSGCVPMKRFSHVPILKDLAQPMVFFKCFKGKKLETCMKKDLKEKFGSILDEKMMTMARQMGHSDLTRGDNSNSEQVDSIFNMIYGFDMNSGVDDIF